MKHTVKEIHLEKIYNTGLIVYGYLNAEMLHITSLHLGPLNLILNVKIMLCPWFQSTRSTKVSPTEDSVWVFFFFRYFFREDNVINYNERHLKLHSKTSKLTDLHISGTEKDRTHIFIHPSALKSALLKHSPRTWTPWKLIRLYCGPVWRPRSRYSSSNNITMEFICFGDVTFVFFFSPHLSLLGVLYDTSEGSASHLSPRSVTLPVESPLTWRSCRWNWYHATITRTIEIRYTDTRFRKVFPELVIWTMRAQQWQSVFWFPQHDSFSLCDIL